MSGSPIDWRRDLKALQMHSLMAQLHSTSRPTAEYLGPAMFRNVAGAEKTIRDAEPDAQSNDLIGQFWEALGGLPDTTDRNLAKVWSAVGYELAGFQANAHAVLRDVSLDELDPLTACCALFLRRRLVHLKQRATTLLTEKANLESLSASERLGIVALDGLASYLIHGDERSLAAAESDLGLCMASFAEEGLFVQAQLTRGLRVISTRLPTRAAWSVLRQWSAGRPTRQRYLMLSARGTGANVPSGTSVTELWPSQMRALEAGVLDPSVSSIALRLPTSAGKTRIAELAILTELTNGKKAIYVAPFKSLANELVTHFRRLVGDLGYSVSAGLGAYYYDPVQELLTISGDIVILTPERLDQIHRENRATLSTVGIIVVDEAHIVEDLSRGLKMDFLLTRLRRTLPKTKFLLLSAMLADRTAAELAEWLQSHAAGSTSVPISSNWRPSRQLFALTRWEGENAFLEFLDPPDKEHKAVAIDEPVIRHRKLRALNEETRRIRTREMPKDKSDIAAELALRFSRLGPVLVYTSQPSWTTTIGNAIADLITFDPGLRPDWWMKSQFGSRAAGISKEWIADDRINDLYAAGVAIHHGQLSEPLRTAIERDVRDGHFQIVIATSTLAQGVNMPVRTVIMHSAVRFENDHAGRLPARDYWNIAGRAGRAGRESEGLIIHVCSEDRDVDNAKYYFARSGDRPESLSPLYLLAATRLDLEAFRDLLDAELLTLAFEEIEADAIVFAEGIAAESLGWRQAIARNVNPAPIAAAVEAGLRAIWTAVPDSHERSVYASTGLPSSVCVEFAKRLKRIDCRNDFLSLADVDQIRSIICNIVTDVGELALIGVPANIWQQACAEWLAGARPEALFDAMRTSEGVSSVDARKVLDYYLTYILPWYASAVLRIACAQSGVALPDCPDEIRYFPSMAKHGVSSPSAAEAVSLGVSSRSLAQRLATSWAASDQSQTFRSWLRNMDHDDLINRHGAKGFILQDLTEDLSAAYHDERIIDAIENDEVLPLEVRLLISIHDVPPALLSPSFESAPCFLERDYATLLDRNYIMVQYDGKDLRVLPRRFAALIAPMIDTGSFLSASVVGVTPPESGEVYTITIVIDELLEDK